MSTLLLHPLHPDLLQAGACVCNKNTEVCFSIITADEYAIKLKNLGDGSILTMSTQAMCPSEWVLLTNNK